MTAEAIEIHGDMLGEQLGENGLFSELAVYDPEGQAIEVYGIFDEADKRDDIDSGGVTKKKKIRRFIVKDFIDFDIYLDKELLIKSQCVTYKIQYVDRDDKGVQVVWLD